MPRKIAVILSGCGIYDGAEIQESVITLLRLDQRGCQVQCFAPNVSFAVVDHLTGETTGERRQVLVEAARIARGRVKDVREARVGDFDGLIIPGGSGSAKNLSDFASKGPHCSVLPDVLALAEAFAEERKPVGLMCISAALAAKIYGPTVTCTLGKDDATAAVINQMGAIHQACEADDIVEDVEHKLVTTPAYMGALSISEAAAGINKLVDRVVEIARAGQGPS
ncbi:isoprenoid biosynthesis glyoxalase ElbB [Pseudomonas typographi]|uniref:isoprenoid biosynthesis glyoxalase ElbB n=1 Tax=Pseudomonas typographi TaxID=2715964 RepID=UPI0016841AF5|nr:isoprenoid biosynthesis glyoxalase ElbB [Pseudomonas typographi]MBD1586071.1 isoprenoid biosynthesis glyoxalase ElbB [Pseudomonas typographi]